MNLSGSKAYWSEKDQRWHIFVQSNGVRKHFASDVGLKTRKGRIQAEQRANEWLETRLTDDSQKVAVLFDKWIESLKQRTQTAHWTQYSQYGRNWIKPAIGNKRMSQLNENDFDEIIAAGYKHGLAKKTLMNIRSCITAFLRYARKIRATTLIADDIIIPKNAATREKKILSQAEIAIVFQSDETTYYKKNVQDFFIYLYRFLIFEGLRPGEVLGLQWTDIKENEYKIVRSINAYNEITSGKNANARRRHHLSSFSRTLLNDQKNMLHRAGIVSPYVFPWRDGSAAKEHNVYAAWIKYCEHNGIRPVSLYELRHTNFSVNKSMPSALKKLLFGHSNDFDGDAVYSHEMDGDLEAASKMNEAAFLAIIE